MSVSPSGNRALVGARLTDDNGTDSGSAYVFVFNGTSWSEEAKLLPSDGVAGDFFGTTVSLSGNRALVGAPFKAGTGMHSGAAYILVFDGTSWTQEVKLNASDSGNVDNFGDSVSLAGNQALISVPFNGNGAAYYFVLSGGTWSQQAKLLPTAAPVSLKQCHSLGVAPCWAAEALLLQTPRISSPTMAQVGARKPG